MASERKFISENIRRVLLKEFFQKETEMAGFGGIDIQRTPMGTRVTLTVERPGMVIGRKGSKIKELTRTVTEQYSFDNPQIEVQECKNSAKNSQIMAQKLALALERGWHFRRAGHSTLRRVMDTDVQGCQVKLSGKLTGQRHRTEKFKRGHIKFCGEPALTTMDRGYAIAKKKLGLIGVSVDIMKSDAKLPDKVIIHDIPELQDVAEMKGEYELEAEKAKAAEEREQEIVGDGDSAEDVPESGSEPEEEEKPETKQESEETEKREEMEEEKKTISNRKAKRVERRKEKAADTEETTSEEAEKETEKKSTPSPKKTQKKKEDTPPEPEKKEETEGKGNEGKTKEGGE